MGHYCCCGQRTSDPCECNWEGWHNLKFNENDLPDKDGTYQVRMSEDGEKHECESKFSIMPKRWCSTSIKDFQWERDYEDGWTGWSRVYAWKQPTIINNETCGMKSDKEAALDELVKQAEELGLYN